MLSRFNLQPRVPDDDAFDHQQHKVNNDTSLLTFWATLQQRQRALKLYAQPLAQKSQIQ